MTAMLSRGITVAVFVVALSASSVAQRGGAHGVSIAHAGAMHGPSGFSARPALSTPPSAMRGAPVTNLRMPGSSYSDLGRRFGYPNRYRRSIAPFYGVGLPYVFAGPPFDFSSFPDNGYYGDSGYAAAPAPETYPASAYEAPSVEQPAPPPSTAYREPYVKSLPEPEPEDAVTLVFKDGRPNEQIHNYMLTRTTLYVQDGRRREIAVADLDLPATVKLNHDAGVDFQLPASVR